MTDEGVETLEGLLGHRFKDRAVLTRALMHASAIEDRSQSNERLEFLGDRVLGLVIAETLYQTFTDEDEGALARRFSGLTSREGLVRVAAAIGLERFMQTQRGDQEAARRAQAAFAADTMEAVLGALYLDGGLKPARAFIQSQWAPLMDADLTPPKDAKTALQEWAQGLGLGLPAYALLHREGPDHAPRFTVKVEVKSKGEAKGKGASRRAAEQAAAEALLDIVGEAS